MEPSDKALVLACREGNPAAWETLVERYQRLIFAIPRRAGLDEDQCAEVFQHVFTTLVEKLDSIEQPDRIKAWLVTTALRESRRLSRRARTVGSLPTVTDEDQDQDDDISDGGLLPEEILLRLEQQDTVRAALAKLDERCRLLLTLLFYRPDPPSYTEIAQALGTTEGSIGPTRVRCLEKLRRLLDKNRA
jgi:RNA polymerase sigma factor (sigma-70 family)